MMKWFARQRFRFDLGQSALSILQFAAVMVAASDKLTSLIQLPAKVIVPAAVIIAILLVWLCGYILDRFQFWDRYQDELNKRNKMLSEIHRR